MTDEQTAPDEGETLADWQAADLRILREMMHGEGEHLTERQLYEAWSAFSADFCAHWLMVDVDTLGNFAGYLVRKLYDADGALRR